MIIYNWITKFSTASFGNCDILMNILIQFNVISFAFSIFLLHLLLNRRGQHLRLILKLINMINNMNEKLADTLPCLRWYPVRRHFQLLPHFINLLFRTGFPKLKKILTYNQPNHFYSPPKRQKHFPPYARCRTPAIAGNSPKISDHSHHTQSTHSSNPSSTMESKLWTAPAPQCPITVADRSYHYA